MIVLALLVLVAIGAVVVLTGALASGDEGEGGRRGPGRLFGGAGPALGLLAGLGVLVVLVAAPLVLVGLGRSGRDGGDAPAREAGRATTTSVARAPTTTTASRAAAPDRSAVPEPVGDASAVPGGPEVRVSADDTPGFPPLPPAVDELEPGTVLRVRAAGFPADVTGEVVQCIDAGGEPVRCRNAFPVRFDDRGRAYVQYAVAPLPGGCRLDAPSCVVVVRALGGEVRASARTVFVDTLPEPGTVTVRPRRGLDDGEVVTVAVEGFPAGTAHVVQCVAPATGGSEACGPPGPVATMVVGRDGTATTTFTVRTGPVGSAGEECGRRTTCGIAVLGEGGAAIGRAVPLSFSAGPGASYDDLRLAAGLAVAALLLVVAFALVRLTDWREPTEAATPELDAASLEVPEFDVDDEDDGALVDV